MPAFRQVPCRVGRALPAALPPSVVPRRGRCPPYENTGTSSCAAIPRTTAPCRHLAKRRIPRRAGTARGSSAIRRSATRAVPALREHRHIVVCRHSTNDGPMPAFRQVPCRVGRALPAALPRCVVPRRGQCPPYESTGTSPCAAIPRTAAHTGISPSTVIPVGRALPAALPRCVVPQRGRCPPYENTGTSSCAAIPRTTAPRRHFTKRRDPRRAGTARGSSAIRRSATRAMPALREHRHIAVRRHSTHRDPCRHFTKHRDPRRAGTARGSSAMRRSAARAVPALREHRHIAVRRRSTNDGPMPAFRQVP